MRFVKYSYNEKEVYAFCLDYLYTFSTNEDEETVIILNNGEQRILDIDIEDFVAAVFSDESTSDDYQIREIDSRELKRPNSGGIKMDDFKPDE